MSKEQKQMQPTCYVYLQPVASSNANYSSLNTSHLHSQTQTDSMIPSSLSLTPEPPTWRHNEPQRLAQTWSSLSLSHNCALLLMTDYVTWFHTYTHSDTPHNPPLASQGFLKLTLPFTSTCILFQAKQPAAVAEPPHTHSKSYSF